MPHGTHKDAEAHREYMRGRYTRLKADPEFRERTRAAQRRYRLRWYGRQEDEPRNIVRLVRPQERAA
jgi:hypothetical protein